MITDQPAARPTAGMNLRDLLAVAEHEHFGRAVKACGISQPTLSVQIRKLKEQLGVELFERTSKTMTPTSACERLIGYARAAVAEAIIPTLAPACCRWSSLPEALPALKVEPWEDQTTALIEWLRAYNLDAALLGTQVDGTDLASLPLLAEPFLAALPPEHPLAGCGVVVEADLARDILVLADGHACATRRWRPAERWVARCGRQASRRCSTWWLPVTERL